MTQPSPQQKAAATRARKSAEAQVEHDRKYYKLFPEPEGNWWLLESRTRTVEEAVAYVLDQCYGVPDPEENPEPAMAVSSSLWLAGEPVAVFLVMINGPPRVIRFQ